LQSGSYQSVVLVKVSTDNSFGINPAVGVNVFYYIDNGSTINEIAESKIDIKRNIITGFAVKDLNQNIYGIYVLGVVLFIVAVLIYLKKRKNRQVNR